MRRGKYIYYIRIYISANIVSISAPSAERIIISAIISSLSLSTGGLCGLGLSNLHHFSKASYCHLQ